MAFDLSIVVPAYDEELRVGASVSAILQYLTDNSLNAELVIVDDGSKDNTADVARETAAKFPEIATNVIRYEQNRGKGFAVKTGLQAAKSAIALFSDADLSTPIEEMDKLLDPIRSGKFDVTFGSRALDRTLIGTHQPWLRENGGRVVNFMIRKMSGLEFADTQCGFKAFDLAKFRHLLDVMQIDRFGFDIEFLYVAKHHGLRLAEIPVRWNDVAGSKVSPFRDTRRMFTELAQIRRNSKQGKYDISQDS